MRVTPSLQSYEDLLGVYMFLSGVNATESKRRTCESEAAAAKLRTARSNALPNTGLSEHWRELGAAESCQDETSSGRNGNV